jgi:hypothetical protein
VRGSGLRAAYLTSVRSWTLTTGHSARPYGGPVGTFGPVPTFLTAAPGCTLELQLEAPRNPSALGAVPFFFLSTGRAPGTDAGRHIGLELLGCWVGGALGQEPCRVSVPLPEDVALFGRPLGVRAAFHLRGTPHGSRWTWSNALDLVAGR